MRSRSASRHRQRAGSITETEIKECPSIESQSNATRSVSINIASEPNSAVSALDSPIMTNAIHVLRIYSGNVDLNATFKTVVWNEETTVETLLAATLKRFKVADTSIGEYYLSVLHFDSQEKRLPAHEKVQRLLENLSSAKLPGLSTGKKVTKVLAGVGANSIIINDDQIIKILVNRNAHMSFASHLRLVRVFMYDEADPTGVARTSKTLSVAEAMRVSELAALAGRKFKIAEAVLGEYWLLTRSKGREILRDVDELVDEILAQENDGSTEPIDFVLRRYVDSNVPSMTAASSIVLPHAESQAISSFQSPATDTTVSLDSPSSSSSLASITVEPVTSPVVSPRLTATLRSNHGSGGPQHSYLSDDAILSLRGSRVPSSQFSPVTASNRLSTASNASATAMPEPSSAISIAPIGGVGGVRGRPTSMHSTARLSSLLGMSETVALRKGSMVSGVGIGESVRQRYDELERDLSLFSEGI
ncbi:hypothetical protein BC830DRAFT_391160 [Chytriomyces sp. MP71]|nr:hypothetical protein BC830DRAFT_391160 [Chytriomyces sp. MP71]